MIFTSLLYMLNDKQCSTAIIDDLLLEIRCFARIKRVRIKRNILNEKVALSRACDNYVSLHADDNGGGSISLSADCDGIRNSNTNTNSSQVDFNLSILTTNKKTNKTNTFPVSILFQETEYWDIAGFKFGGRKVNESKLCFFGGALWRVTFAQNPLHLDYYCVTICPAQSLNEEFNVTCTFEFSCFMHNDSGCKKVLCEATGKFTFLPESYDDCGDESYISQLSDGSAGALDPVVNAGCVEHFMLCSHLQDLLNNNSSSSSSSGVGGSVDRFLMVITMTSGR